MPVTIQVKTPGRSAMIDVTDRVAEKVRESGIRSGLCVVYVPHTTAGIMVNEGADPDVASDILDALEKLVPRQAAYRHTEGNSAAHIKAALVGGSVHLIVEAGAPVLGTWERIFFCEFDGPRTRKLHVKVIAG